LLLKYEREKREHSAFAAVIRAKNENQVFDADDEDESPDDKRKNSVDIFWCRGKAILRLEALAEGVERTRPDVAIDDTEGYQSQLSESLSCRPRLGMIADVELPVLTETDRLR
jgi:hypothetical protein